MLVRKGFEIIKLLETMKRQAASSSKPPQQQHIDDVTEFKSADGHDAQPHEGTTNANDLASTSGTVAHTDNALSFALVEKLTELEKKVLDQKNKD